MAVGGGKGFFLVELNLRAKLPFGGDSATKGLAFGDVEAGGVLQIDVQTCVVDQVAEVVVEGVDGEHVGFAHLVGYRFVLFRHSCMLVCCAVACAMGEERSRQTGWMCILLILLIFVKLQRNDTTRRILP